MLEINQIHTGDCLEIMKKISDNSINLIFTDPPYNLLNFDDIKTTTIIKRDVDWDKKIIDIFKLMEEFERILVDGGTFLIFCSDRQLGKYIDYCAKSKTLKYSNTLVWVDRLGHPNVRKRSFSNHSQYIAYGHKEIEDKYTFNWLGEKKMWNILNYNGCTSFEYGKARNGRLGEWVGHPTQKPTKLVRHLVKICSNEGDIILDPFNGSGTTTLIAKQLQRKYIGIELEEKYVNIAKRRLCQKILSEVSLLSSQP